MKKNHFTWLICLCNVLFAAELIPLPTTVNVDEKKVQLGKKLFLDTILSKDNTLSCMSCHNLKHNGADVVAHTKGIGGETGVFNVPTVYNAVYNFRQFWDGRAKDLEDQALENPVEMGNTIEKALQSLKKSSTYV